MGKVLSSISVVFAVALSLFHLYAAYMGTIDPWSLRIIHLTLGLAIVFLTCPLFKGKEVSWHDLLLVILSLACGLYVILNLDAIIDRSGMPNQWDIIFGIMTILLVLEMTRRVVGMPLVVVVGVFLLYAVYGNHLTGILGHRGYSLERIAAHMYTSMEGIFGLPLGVSASFVILFVIFGAFLEATKTGDFFMNFANAIAGKAIGGPAKVAVISSSLFGTISGSAVANVVATGTYTIPLMKRTGYSPHFAGSVEAVASSGGQLMPPVMGAAAFVIAEMTGISYLKICLAALIPAILYYGALFGAVHFEAHRVGLRGLRDEDVPRLWPTVKSQGYLSLSALVLVYFLAIELKSPQFSAFWAIVASIIVSSFSSYSRLNFTSLVKALENGAKGSLSVIAACAAAGIVVGVTTLTGLGLKFSSAVIALSGGNIHLTLILVMIASLILGMGLPTTAAYIICAILAVPALTTLGVDLLAAHLFVFYFAILSAITPPVALAAFAAAGIAGSNAMKTGMTAVRIGLAAFIIPYMFVFNPSLLMRGEPLEIIWAFITASFGAVIFAGATIGWLVTRAVTWERGLLLIGSILMIDPGLITDLIGVSLLVPAIISQLRGRRRT
jgi:TRAP transporter 4TM/12TM fusion protein